MSQTLHFYKLVLFSEQTTEGFSRENIYESLKCLFRGSDPYVAEMVEKHFEYINLDYVSISFGQIENIIPEINQKILHLFNRRTSAFFIVEENIWLAIEQILHNKIIEIMKGRKKSEMADRLQKVSQICSDYTLLNKLFKSKLLFVNVF